MRTVETPSLIGASLRDARRLANHTGVVVVVSTGPPRWWAEPDERLLVVSQAPPPGTPTRRRVPVTVVVDRGAGDRATVEPTEPWRESGEQATMGETG